MAETVSGITHAAIWDPTSVGRPMAAIWPRPARITSEDRVRVEFGRNPGYRGRAQSDDRGEKACRTFGDVADILDDVVRCECGRRRRLSAEALGKVAVAGAAAAGEAGREDLCRRSHQNDEELQVSQAQGGDDAARDVADDRASGADVVVERSG